MAAGRRPQFRSLFGRPGGGRQPKPRSCFGSTQVRAAKLARSARAPIGAGIGRAAAVVSHQP